MVTYSIECDGPVSEGAVREAARQWCAVVSAVSRGTALVRVPERAAEGFERSLDGIEGVRGYSV